MRIIALQILFVLLSALSIRAEVLTGSCGTSCTYSYDTETRVLTISGTGEVSTIISGELLGVKDVVIEEGITVISDNVFESCLSMVSISLPSTLTAIGGQNFYSTNMSSMYIADIASWCKVNMTSYLSAPLNKATGETHLFVKENEGYTEVEHLVFPTEVMEISQFLFRNCKNIKSIEIFSASEIGTGSFSSCSALTNVLIRCNTKLGRSSFERCNNLVSVKMLDESMSTMVGEAFSTIEQTSQLRIYVPKTQLGEYLSDNYWATYKFHAIEDNGGYLTFAKEDDKKSNNLLYPNNRGAWQCRSLVITDGQPFYAPVDFTATRATYDRGVGNVWGTLCLPFDVVASDDVSLYTQGEISNGVLTLTSTKTLLAGQPAIYNICSGKPLSFTVSDASIKANVAPATIESGIRLVGAFERTTVSDQNAYYVKSNQFWRCAEGGSFNVSPYRAYFTVANASSPSFSIAIDPNDPTAINELLAGDEAPLGYYDTMGRRHAKPLKGLNVVKYRNGKSAKIQIM